MEGNYPAVLMNHTDLHYRHKVFQVIQESRDCTRSIWIIFSVLFYFPHGRKKRVGNEIVHGLYGLFSQFCFIFPTGEKKG